MFPIVLRVMPHAEFVVFVPFVNAPQGRMAISPADKFTSTVQHFGVLVAMVEEIALYRQRVHRVTCDVLSVADEINVDLAAQLLQEEALDAHLRF